MPTQRMSHALPPIRCSNGLTGRPATRRLFLGLYLGMVGLYVRNIFRFAEFVQATVLTWPAPEGAYVLSEQQVRGALAARGRRTLATRRGCCMFPSSTRSC